VQLRLSYRPLRGRFSLSAVIHSDNDHPALCLLDALAVVTGSMNVNIGVPSYDKTMIVRTVVRGHDHWSPVIGTFSWHQVLLPLTLPLHDFRY
jgi:hypothetical protein